MIYTNLEAKEANRHGMFESSHLLSTDVGDIFDVIVRDSSENPIDVDNGVPVKIGEFTGNGYEERYATIAGVKDAIAVIGAPAEVKTALTTEQGQAYNYVNKAGKPAKAYRIQDAEIHTDIFAVADYQFTTESADKVKIGALVTTDGKGMYVAQEDDATVTTLSTTNGFIGKIHSVSAGIYYTMVRILVVQNKTVA